MFFCERFVFEAEVNASEVNYLQNSVECTYLLSKPRTR